jgi:putative PIN family toxin of toxin-antitoxin system
MDRVVLDTNVVVSALIGKGNPRKVLELVLAGRLLLCLSASTLSEYVVVLQRPKFSRYPEFAEAASLVLRSIGAIALRVEPTRMINACPDPGDNKFLALAIEANARFLVTGNKKHFPSGSYQDVQIVSPSEFLKMYGR